MIGKFTSQPLGHLSSGFASQKVSDDLLRDLPDEVSGYLWRISAQSPKLRCRSAYTAVFFMVHDLFSEGEDVDPTKIDHAAPRACL
ncbi:MAG: hypothetical protein DMF30_00415 [Verrucomicrobia bacterium]|nr:MAG: hypothetical protein DMF30_00415 [Verrucomicrobiota bacterium]